MKGKIVRLKSDKWFGFIRAESRKEEDYFFHKSCFNGHWDDLVEDFDNGAAIEVEFEVVPSDKGPRAENVTRLDHPNQG